ncbi:hypothetical protein AMR72_10275 [Flavobacterium psychrophilum]|nr:hypothetical protein AMR72_10275 [Flavobacterium psychrophilum]AOE52861.1 hypothetical protein ALW18_10265 [Flavobacterium psychrophilum]
MKILTTIILLFIVVYCSAQDKIITEKTAREFFATAADTAITDFAVLEADGDVFHLCSDKNPGDIVINSNDVYLVRAVEQISIYNCSIISLNKDTLGNESYQKLQKSIPIEYNFGISFRQISDKYGTTETTSDNINLFYESLNEGILKDGLTSNEPGKMFLAELSENISYLIVVNSPPVKQKALFLSQPKVGLKFLD